MRLKIKDIPLQNSNHNLLTDEIVVKALSANSYVTRRDWGIWLFTLSLVLIGFMFIMDIAPYLHKDEFMIVDLGRVILNPNTDWSLNWLVNQQQPAFLFSYVGPVLQEVAYQLGGQLGPRVLSIIGGGMAATVMIGWLLARGTNRKAAFLLGLAFLLEPLFVQAFTIGRLDGWAIALCLGSCWVLRKSKKYSAKPNISKARLLLAGAMASLAFFVWPSALFLFPLIALELFYTLGKSKNFGENLHKFGQVSLIFSTGAILVTMLLLLPIYRQFFTLLDNILEGLNANTQARPELSDNILSSLKGMISVLKYTPVLAILSLIGIFKFPRLGLLIALFTTTSLMLATIVYMHRVLYLVPYFFASIGHFYQWENQSGNTSYRLIKLTGLAALIFWSAGLSLGLRTIMAIDAKAEENRDLVHRAAVSMLGPGEHKVLLLSSAELYYPGRSLGWKMYDLYLGINEILKPEILQKSLPQFDYVIIREPYGEEIKRTINAGGMYYNTSYKIYDGSAEKFQGITTNIWRLRFLFSNYEQPYGPYKLYTRKKNKYVEH